MFLREDNLITDLEHNYAEAFNLYRDDIFKLHQNIWKEERVAGHSFLYFKVMQYYLAFYLGVLIYLDFKEGLLSKDELWAKYEIDCKRDILACHGIDIDAILDAFGIVYTVVECGIGSVTVDTTLVVDSIVNYTNVPYVVDIKDFLTNKSCSFNTITDDKIITRTTLNIDSNGLSVGDCDQYILV
jgi:uncharacterized UPF0146 family protein